MSSSGGADSGAAGIIVGLLETVGERDRSATGPEARTGLGSLARSCRGRRSAGDPAKQFEVTVVAERDEVT